MQAGSIGCVDFAKPFVMAAGSTFKDVGGRANVVAVVYVPDPPGQLMPSQVAQYALHIGRISSLKLPLRPGAPTSPNMYGEVGTSSTPNPLLIDSTGNLEESDDEDTMTITPPAVPRHSAYDPTFTHPFHAEGGGSNRASRRRRATLSGVSLSAHRDATSSTTQSQVGDVWCSQARNVEARDVGWVASEPVLARTSMPAQNGTKLCVNEAGGGFEGTQQSGIVGTPQYGLDHGPGARVCTPLQRSPWSDASSDDSDSVHVLSAISPPTGGSRSAAHRGAQSACAMPVVDEQLQLDSDASRGTSSDASEYVPRATHMQRPLRSGPAAGADRAADALQEAEDAFMAADLKYNTACEAQTADVLDLNEPVKHVSTIITQNLCVSSYVHGILGHEFCAWECDGVAVWQGSVAQAVEDEVLAVVASRKRFWKAFEAELGLSCEDTVEGQAITTLARRRGSCRGLTPHMITNEVATLRECPSMHAYNTEFIVAAFNAIAQPDWWVWDILEKCFPEDDVKVWSAEKVCEKLGSRVTTTVGDKASMEAVVARLHTWRQAESTGGARNKEIDYLVAYRNRNEAWNYYRLCAIRYETLGDYRAALLKLPVVPLPVSTIRLNQNMS